MAGGDGQSGTRGAAAGQPLVVLVTDDNGNPVEGVSVGWAAQGGGSVSAETTETGSDGLASVGRVLGSQPGEQTTTASVSGLEGSPVTFLATATDGRQPSARDEDPACECRTERGAARGATGGSAPGCGGNDQAQSGLEVTASLVGTTGTLGGTLTRSTDGNGEAAFTDLMITGPAGQLHAAVHRSGHAPGLLSAIAITLGGCRRRHRDHD